jgi:hypothetical protein
MPDDAPVMRTTFCGFDVLGVDIAFLNLRMAVTSPEFFSPPPARERPHATFQLEASEGDYGASGSLLVSTEAPRTERIS